MKVKELIEKLQKANKEAEVVFDDTDWWLKWILFVKEVKAKSEDWDIDFFILKYNNNED